jgi:hypothetical protein
MKRMASLRAFALTAWMVAIAGAQAATEAPLQATTDDGRKVVLHPDGRWEFGSSDRATAPAESPATPAKASQPAATSTSARSDERYCQGGLFGVGRRICPGDPEYNRGSLNPKLR